MVTDVRTETLSERADRLTAEYGNEMSRHGAPLSETERSVARAAIIWALTDKGEK